MECGRPGIPPTRQRTPAQKRRAHLLWESGGRRGSYALGAEAGGATLVGTSQRCDLRVPRGPRHSLLVVRSGQGFEARNLSLWRRMRVNGRTTKNARLGTGDVIEMGPLKVTFMDEVR